MNLSANPTSDGLRDSKLRIAEKLLDWDVQRKLLQAPKCNVPQFISHDGASYVVIVVIGSTRVSFPSCCSCSPRGRTPSAEFQELWGAIPDPTVCGRA